MKKDLSIEDSFKALDKIINQMDDDKCSIEKGLELYENGVKIINDLSKRIDNKVKSFIYYIFYKF